MTTTTAEMNRAAAALAEAAVALPEASSATPSVDPEEFKAVMASVCTPVSVITTMVDGAPHGTTVSAFASLSLTPPLVMLALDRGSQLLKKVAVSGRFGVNVLGSGQQATAMAFARKGDKFADVLWVRDDGLPRIVGVAGWLGCRVDGEYDGGDHVILMGHVETAEARTDAPLTYHRRTFGTHVVRPHREEDGA